MRRKKTILGALFFVTALLVAAGWYQLFRFAATPGAQEAAPSIWPATEAWPGDRHAPLLLVFVHPGCSCTRATLEQLDRMMESSRTAASIVLEVYRSESLNQQGYGAAFQASPWLERSATIAADVNGQLARRFHAKTSGEVLLYSRQGRLLFQGGITPARGHVGDSLGAGRLRSALATGLPQETRSAVFGCLLFHAPGRG